MTVQEALAKWNDAATVAVLGKVVFLTGNREPLADALRPHAGVKIEVTDLPSPRVDWKTIIKVTPAGEKPTPFYLCVE